ncbi:MAG: glycogen synthase GlgA, partial [Nitrospinota bacterium]
MARRTARARKILYVTPEVAPLATTGGLGDVAGALPPTLRALGHDVRVVMPYYRAVKEKGIAVQPVGSVFPVPLGERNESCQILQAEMQGGVPLYLVQKDKYYDREFLYGPPQGDYPDNAERFIFFCRAIPEMVRREVFHPEVIHANDWQTGLIPVYLKTLYREDPRLQGIKTVFTIHNLAYQGLFWYFDLPLTGLPPSLFSPEGIEFYGKISLMKAGIVFADVINTVSKKYREEIQTEAFGCGLDGVLRARRHVLYGILNGVDYQEWNPATDRYIVAHYDPEHLEGKRLCKQDLLSWYGLPQDEEKPVIGMVTRLVEQKGCDLVAEAMDRLLALGVSFVLLATGEERYQQLFQTLRQRYPAQVGVRIEFNHALAHKVVAGADMLLMPSRFEPCGLTQIYALKYGTIPVVHATGGLDDTIQNYKVKTGRGNGFKFQEYSATALLQKVEEALT